MHKAEPYATLTPMFAYDDQLLAAVQPAPQSVDDMIRAMRAREAGGDLLGAARVSRAFLADGGYAGLLVPVG
jgi:hypothetical protein